MVLVCTLSTALWSEPVVGFDVLLKQTKFLSMEEISGYVQERLHRKDGSLFFLKLKIRDPYDIVLQTQYIFFKQRWHWFHSVLELGRNMCRLEQKKIHISLSCKSPYHCEITWIVKSHIHTSTSHMNYYRCVRCVIFFELCDGTLYNNSGKVQEIYLQVL